MDLWVVLDEQYADALGLLSDENYVIANPLTEAEMAELETKAASELTTGLKTGPLANLIIIPTVIILLALGIYLKRVW